MFRRQRAWYWRVVGILIALRMMYAGARFFLKMAVRQAKWEDRISGNRKRRLKRG
jgi:hypothetical protein